MNAQTPHKKTCIGLAVALLASVFALPVAANNVSDQGGSTQALPNTTQADTEDWCSSLFDPDTNLQGDGDGYNGDSSSCDASGATTVMTMQNTGGYNGVITNFAGCDPTGTTCTLGFEGFMDSTSNVDPASTSRNAFGADSPVTRTVTITVNPPAEYRVWVSTRDLATGAATANTIVAGATSLLWTDVICIGSGANALTITADGATTAASPPGFVPDGTITSVVGARIVGDSLAGCPPTNQVPRTVTITPTYTYTSCVSSAVPPIVVCAPAAEEAGNALATASITPGLVANGFCEITYLAEATTFDTVNWSRAFSYYGLNGQIDDEDSISGGGAQAVGVGDTVVIANGDIAVAWASATQIGDLGDESLDAYQCISTPCDPTSNPCPCPAPFTGTYTVPPGPTTCVPPTFPLECFDMLDNDGVQGTDFTDPDCMACPIGAEDDPSVCTAPGLLPLPTCIDSLTTGETMAGDDDGNGDGDFFTGSDPECDPTVGGFPLLNEDGTIPYTSLECLDGVDNEGMGDGTDFDGFGDPNGPDPQCDIFQGGNPLVREDGSP